MKSRFGWMLGIAWVLAAGFVVEASATDYEISGSNAKVQFEGTKKDGKHIGSFPKLSGKLSIPQDLSKTKLAVTIDMDALTSDDEKLTGHLKSPDFFETKKFPEAKFISKTVKVDKNTCSITGDLTIRDKTKQITIPAKITNDAGVTTLSAEFKINRSDWGITYGEGKIDEAVKLTIDLKVK